MSSEQVRADQVEIGDQVRIGGELRRVTGLERPPSSVDVRLEFGRHLWRGAPTELVEVERS